MIYELTTISIWGGLGRQGSRGLQLGMASYYLVANGHYVIWLYYNFYRSVEILYSLAGHNLQLRAGDRQGRR